VKEDVNSAIIFDFDGTIADSFLIALSITYELVHREPLPDEDISRLRSMSLIQVLRELRIPPWRVPFLLRRIRRRMSGRMDEIMIIPGIGEIIKALSEEHKLFILSSNSAANVRVFLQRFGIEGCFSGIYGNVSPLRKASKLLKLVRENSLSIRDAWYVGDEARDIKAAHLACLKSAAVTWGYSNIHALKSHQPDKLVFSPDELMRCFVNNELPKNA
jgi:phosphoglycolate phosphatase